MRMRADFRSVKPAASIIRSRATLPRTRTHTQPPFLKKEKKTRPPIFSPYLAYPTSTSLCNKEGKTYHMAPPHPTHNAPDELAWVAPELRIVTTTIVVHPRHCVHGMSQHLTCLGKVCKQKTNIHYQLATGNGINLPCRRGYASVRM